MRLAIEILALAVLASATGYGLAVWQEKRTMRKAREYQRTVLAGCGCFWCKG